MFRWMTASVMATCLLNGAVRATAQTPTQSTPAPAGPRDLLLVIDSSGSMSGRTVDGTPKIEVARRTLTGMIRRLPDDLHVGLLAFGHRHSTQHPETCQDIELLAPVARADQDLLAARVQELRPRGKTPLASSLSQAIDILEGLGSEREKALVVVTDGLETCGGDVIAIAARLQRLGFKLEFYVVGFDLIRKEQEVLREVARAGGGKFLNAQDAGELERAFETLHEELIVRATPVQRQVIVAKGTGPGHLRTVGNGEEGIGNFIAVLFKRTDTLIELPQGEAERGLTLGEFWGLGARVLAVAAGSPAAAAGLIPGDLIVQADETPVLTARQLEEALTGEADLSEESAGYSLRVARFEPQYPQIYSTSEPDTLELSPGVYQLLAVQRVAGLLSQHAERAGSWMLLDQSSAAYLTPLAWGLRVESARTYEVPLNVGLRLEHGKARYGDVLRLVEVESRTEISFAPNDFYLAFRGEQPFAATVPVPQGRYTIQWKRGKGGDWYTVIEDHEYDGKSLVTIRF